MNASDRPNTCKSRGSVAAAMLLTATGARVRNAYRTYPLLGNSLAKARLMPDVPRLPHGKFGKDLLVKDGDASH